MFSMGGIYVLFVFTWKGVTTTEFANKPSCANAAQIVLANGTEVSKVFCVPKNTNNQ